MESACAHLPVNRMYVVDLFVILSVMQCIVITELCIWLSYTATAVFTKFVSSFINAIGTIAPITLCAHDYSGHDLTGDSVLTALCVMLRYCLVVRIPRLRQVLFIEIRFW